MTTQPRALYLAEILQSEPGAVADAAAEELRRLHSVNAELVEALKGVIRVADRKTDEFDAARAAIKKAEGA